jgi:probable O-glycosylation ligase (exosortase A-associated)
MRDVFVTLLIAGVLPLVFTRPFYGLVMFTWLAYMRAPDLCWGFAKTIRFSLVVALLMFVGFFLYERKKFYVSEIRNNLLTLFAVLIILSVIVNQIKLGMAYGKYEEFTKIILIAVFTVTIVDSQWKLRIMCWTIALSLGFYGIKCGIFGFLGGEVFQGPGGLLLDNNDFSLAMVMNLPFLFYLSMEEKHPHVKLFLRVLVFFTIVTIIATRSRGGFLALAMVYFVMTMKSRHKMLSFSIAFLGLILFLIFIPEEYVERLKSITDTKEQSAASRLVAWHTALIMIKANPLMGVGLGNFVHNYHIYAPVLQWERDGTFVPHVAHNSYLQIWAECGTPAFFVFVLILLITLVKLRRLRRENAMRDGPTWITHYCNIFEVSMYGYFVGATFLNRGMFDLIYQIVGLTAAMSFIADRAFTEQKDEGPPVLTIRSKDGYIVPGKL